MTPLVIEVVRRRGARPVQPPSAPLPPAVLAALAAIVRDMRDVPRDCFMDRAEMITWLNRMARRVEGITTMRAPLPALPRPSGPSRLPRPVLAAPTARQAAEAVFASPFKACAAKGMGGDTRRSANTPATAGQGLAEAVFGQGNVPGRNASARIVTSRKGRTVPVEIRRARAGGQMVLGL